MNKIIGYQFNGLCNRIYTLLNVEYLLDQHGYNEAAFVWALTPRCNCLFRDVLSAPHSRVKILGRFKQIETELAGKFIPVIRRRHQLIDDVPHEVAICCNPAPLLPQVLDYWELYDWSSEVKKLIPNVDLSQIAGVHIRRTDGTPGMIAPIEKFEQEIGKHQRVFLATDDENVKARILDKFPQTITLAAPEREPTDSVAIQYAAAELACLSQCAIVVGTRASSFSRFATDLSGKRRVLVN